MQPTFAAQVAFIAHTACGQYRADGVTPYYHHPVRVAELTRRFSLECELRVLDNSPIMWDRMTAAYLHDVLEDTKLKRDDLLKLGVTFNQLDIIERLTKPDNGPAPASYYQAIAESDDALVVKCADRCANIDDAFKELVVDEPKEPRRWSRYIEKTYSDVLPMFAALPGLRYQLEWRLSRVEMALPDALKRRAVVVDRERGRAKLTKLYDAAGLAVPDAEC